MSPRFAKRDCPSYCPSGTPGWITCPGLPKLMLMTLGHSMIFGSTPSRPMATVCIKRSNHRWPSDDLQYLQSFQSMQKQSKTCCQLWCKRCCKACRGMCILWRYWDFGFLRWDEDGNLRCHMLWDAASKRCHGSRKSLGASEWHPSWSASQEAPLLHQWTPKETVKDRRVAGNRWKQFIDNWH